MVRSKDVPKKKPKDPLLTPPSKLRGAGFLDEGLPRNRGGAAMSPAPASVPNYMRGTSSSDAKGGRRRARLTATATAAASASPSARRRPSVRVVARGKVLFPEAPSSPASGSRALGRATCSSTLKEAKFPAALDLAPGATDAEGPAAMRVCPYTYCSLNGHAHAPAVPLRSFLASRRRLIKTQQSMKLKGVSAFRKKSGDKNGGGAAAASKIAPLIDEEAVGDFFVEVYAGPRVSSDMSCSDMSLDEMDATVRKMEFLVFDRCGADVDDEKGHDLAACGDAEREGRLEEKHDGAYRDGASVCSDAVISSDLVEELPWMRYHGYEYDSLDDGISEEQRTRDDEIDGAEISQEQGCNIEEGSSGRLSDECEVEAAGQHEAHDPESNLVRESEIDAEQEGDACREEACQEPDERDEDNTLDTPGECSAGQRTADAKLSDDADKLEVLDQEVVGRVESTLEESCKEESAADYLAKDDECRLDSDGESEAVEEQDVKDEEGTPDNVSEMEISEGTISGDGCIEDFTEEVTSRAVLPDDVFEQYDSIVQGSTADDVFEQDGSPVNAQNDAQKELGILTSKLGDASEETDIAQEINLDNTMDGMKDCQKELEITTSELDVACEESGTAQESNRDGTSTCIDNGAQMEPEITICMSKDASEESDVSQERSLNDNAEYVADDSEMGLDISRCKLEDGSEETGIDQESVEDDDSEGTGIDSACVSDDARNDSEASKESITTHEADQSDSFRNVGFDAEETVEDDGSACVIDDVQNHLEIRKCKSEDASKESVSTQDADQSDSPAIVNFGAQNESELTTIELKVIDISEDTGNESKSAECKPEDISEESVIGQEADHNYSLACVTDGTPNESEATTCELEDAQESDIFKDDEDAGGHKKADTTACELGVPFGKPAMPQQTDGHVNTAVTCDCAQKDITTPKLDVCEDILVTEDTNQSFNLPIPKHKYDCTAKGQAEPQNIPAAFTDAKEPSIDDICNAFSGMNLKGTVYCDPPESATCTRNKLIISRRRRTPEEEEYLRGFNPRAPNFLPVELDPDAETVDLRHQMVDERKNAEEWMIDYALRRAVTNLAPARKKKVELLVQAFETVLPHDEDDKKSITPTRHVQACS